MVGRRRDFLMPSGPRGRGTAVELYIHPAVAERMKGWRIGVQVLLGVVLRVPTIPQVFAAEYLPGLEQIPSRRLLDLQYRYLRSFDSPKSRDRQRMPLPHRCCHWRIAVLTTGSKQPRRRALLRRHLMSSPLAVGAMYMMVQPAHSASVLMWLGHAVVEVGVSV